MRGIRSAAITLAMAIVIVSGACSSSSEQSIDRFPEVSDRGGPRMASPRIVPVFYDDDPDPDGIIAFSTWIVHSSWLEAVGAEYGVGPGSVLGTRRRARNAPDAMTDEDIVASLFADRAAGTLPIPEDGGFENVLYMVYLPEHTTVTSGPSESCREFAGYHDSVRRDGINLAYAVVPTCSGFVASLDSVEGREVAASHELIEALTDPYPSTQPAFQIRDRLSDWQALGAEVADLCVRGDADMVTVEAGFHAQRSWSNAAAAKGDPCVPALSPARPYFSVLVADHPYPRVAPGGQTTFRLTGWSTATVDDWQLVAQSSGAVKPTLSLATSTMRANASDVLTVTIPPGAPVESTIQIAVFSVNGQHQIEFVPLVVTVGNACDTFSSCEDCPTHLGCGWCASSSTCQNAGDAHCSQDLALWSGGCPGFCASHDSSCTECASQFGCGFCATAQGTKCHEMGPEWNEPADVACAFVDWTSRPDECPAP